MFDNAQPEKASTWKTMLNDKSIIFGPRVELISYCSIAMKGKCIPTCSHSSGKVCPPSLSGVLEVNICALAPEAWIRCLDSLIAGKLFRRNPMGCLTSHCNWKCTQVIYKWFAMICLHYTVTHLKSCLLPFFQPSWKFAANDAWKTSKCTDIFGTAIHPPDTLLASRVCIRFLTAIEMTQI